VSTKRACLMWHANGTVHDPCGALRLTGA